MLSSRSIHVLARVVLVAAVLLLVVNSSSVASPASGPAFIENPNPNNASEPNLFCRTDAPATRPLSAIYALDRVLAGEPLTAVIIAPDCPPTKTPKPTHTPTFTDTPTHTPTVTFTPTFTDTPTDTPTFTPTFTDTPTDTPTFTPTFTDTPTDTYTHAFPDVHVNPRAPPD